MCVCVCAVDGCTNTEGCSIHRFFSGDHELASTDQVRVVLFTRGPSLWLPIYSSTTPPPSAPALDEGEWQSRVKRSKADVSASHRQTYTDPQRKRGREREKRAAAGPRSPGRATLSWVQHSWSPVLGLDGGKTDSKCSCTRSMNVKMLHAGISLTRMKSCTFIPLLRNC